jgi:hypothetical protein
MLPLPERGHEVCWYAEARHTEVGEDQVQQDQVEVCPQLEPSKHNSYMKKEAQPKRMKGERGISENVSSLSHNIARDDYIECCVQASFLGMETKILFSLLRHIQRYLIMYLKLFLLIFK